MCEQFYLILFIFSIVSWLDASGCPMIRIIYVFFSPHAIVTLISQFQGLILSLTTQLAWTLAVEKESPSSQGIVGALYRSAALKSVSGEKEATDVAAGSSRGQRCVRCGANGGYYGNYGNYADR